MSNLISEFQIVDMIVCETKTKYDSQRKNDTFEFIHLNNTYYQIAKIPSGNVTTSNSSDLTAIVA